MKLKKEFIIYTNDNESFLVPTSAAEFSGVVRGNKTMKAILELLEEETTEEAVIAAMKQRFAAPEGAIERDVQKVISEMRKIGALVE